MSEETSYYYKWGYEFWDEIYEGEKNAKKVRLLLFLFHRVWAHPLPNKKEKKNSSSFLFFPAFLVLEKKIFSEMRCTQRSA